MVQYQFEHHNNLLGPAFKKYDEKKNLLPERNRILFQNKAAPAP